MKRDDLLLHAKPILFNTDMVQAILYGQKTVTRRLPSKQLREKCDEYMEYAFDKRAGFVNSGVYAQMPTAKDFYENHKPYAEGQVLYVRETWSPVFVQPKRYLYKADVDQGKGEGVGLPLKWHPSIHMPKEAARIFLKITSVRMERLQDIDYEGCKAEGIWDDYKAMSEKHHENLARVAYVKVFSELWNDIIKPTDLPLYGWDANPWVWVIEFERMDMAR